MTAGAAPVHRALRRFADAVATKAAGVPAGAPEDRLRGPFEALMAEAASALGMDVVCGGEAPLPGRLGRPDFAVLRSGLLAGYVELKAPGKGADSRRFRGRDRAQFKRFSAVPNMLYGDGCEWALYRGGARAGGVARLSGDPVSEGGAAVSAADAQAFADLLRGFLLWDPVLPLDRRGRMDLEAFAAVLAPLCRMLREDVVDALGAGAPALVRLAAEWRQLLFPKATDAQFADSYAQTVAFALLLGRIEGADPLTLEGAQDALAARHSLLSRALQVLTDRPARAELSASLDLLLRVIAATPPGALAGRRDPWLYFYEDFLTAYDPKLRKDAGVFYTPVEVVRAQVRLVDALLSGPLGRPMGFADSGVVTLDPAAGTGTYLLGVIEHALGRVEAEQGAGAVAGQAAELAQRLYGFEFLAGPYAAGELRVSRALADRGAALPADGARIFLTDTLESPHAEPPQWPLFHQPIAEQHARALEAKSAVPVLVCLGNPPYDRHAAAQAGDGDRTGSWVRYGDGEGGQPILRDFLDPVLAAGKGRQAKNLYNLYVYFWRWALWKVFEHETAAGPGAVSFITASSYLHGDAFLGMREHMRRVCDEVWILDLGGEGRGARGSENVFAIRTPVAIAVAMRTGARRDAPARVRYARIEGTREEKLRALGDIDDFDAVEWTECPTEWGAPFRPAGRGTYFAWPLLADLMPWRHSGVQFKRTWPIAPDEDTLRRRWRALMQSADRAAAFRETRDRTIRGRYGAGAAPIADLPRDAPMPKTRRYAYRSFDRQHIIADARAISRPRPALWAAHGDGQWMFPDTRLGDFLRPALWAAHGGRQLYLTSLFGQPLGEGPAMTACACPPDMDHFFLGGAKDIVPLYRTADASEANIAPGLLDVLTGAYGRPVAPEDFAAYVYGALAHPGFAARFAGELEARELRVPLTRDAGLFEDVREIGARLLWLHTYGERFVPEGERPGRVPQGAARCVEAVPGDPGGYPESFSYGESSRTLRVGAGAFAPVAPDVFEFPVSGFKVVRSWLGYRMKRGKGRKSSPLNDIRPERWTSAFTSELLELLWVLEATVALRPEQARLLAAAAEGPCFGAGDLPPVPAWAREPPARRAAALL